MTQAPEVSSTVTDALPAATATAAVSDTASPASAPAPAAQVAAKKPAARRAHGAGALRGLQGPLLPNPPPPKSNRLLPRQKKPRAKPAMATPLARCNRPSCAKPR